MTETEAIVIVGAGSVNACSANTCQHDFGAHRSPTQTRHR